MQKGVIKQVIGGVKTGPLKKVEDERGSVMHIMRREVYGNGPIGEVYGSYVKPGAVKAWKKNTKCRQSLVVVWGKVKFVMFDESLSILQEETMGGERHAVLEVPAGIWYGFKGEEKEGGLVINTIPEAYQEMTFEKLEANDSRIPYTW